MILINRLNLSSRNTTFFIKKNYRKSFMYSIVIFILDSLYNIIFPILLSTLYSIIKLLGVLGNDILYNFSLLSDDIICPKNIPCLSAG